MKRILAAILLTMTLCLGLTACRSNMGTGTPSDDPIFSADPAPSDNTLADDLQDGMNDMMDGVTPTPGSGVPTEPPANPTEPVTPTAPMVSADPKAAG